MTAACNITRCGLSTTDVLCDYVRLELYLSRKSAPYPSCCSAQDPTRVKKILPFTGQLDLPSDTGAGDDDVDEMIQRLDMAMQVCGVVRCGGHMMITWYFREGEGDWQTGKDHGEGGIM